MTEDAYEVAYVQYLRSLRRHNANGHYGEIPAPRPRGTPELCGAIYVALDAIENGHAKKAERNPGALGRIDYLGVVITPKGREYLAAIDAEEQKKNPEPAPAPEEPRKEKRIMGTKEMLEQELGQGVRDGVSQDLALAITTKVREVFGAQWPEFFKSEVGAQLEPILVVAAVHYAATNFDIPHKDKIASVCSRAVRAQGKDATRVAVRHFLPVINEIAKLADSVPDEDVK